MSVLDGDYRQRLARGIGLRIGPFAVRLASRIPQVADAVSLLYAHHEQLPAAFADFHVRVDASAGMRRFHRPQARFRLDEREPFRPLPLAHAYPFFEWGLNWCVATHAHQYLILHAAVVARGDVALILPGEPGSGKSTLCAALVQRGWRLLSDELALLSPDLGITPLPRPVALKNESIDVIRAFAPEAVLGPAFEDTAKGTVAHMQPPADSVARAAERPRTGAIVAPGYQAGEGARLESRSRAEMLMDLISNCFNFSVWGARGFELLGELVDRCDCHRLAYGDLEQALAALEPLAGPGH